MRKIMIGIIIVSCLLLGTGIYFYASGSDGTCEGCIPLEIDIVHSSGGDNLITFTEGNLLCAEDRSPMTVFHSIAYPDDESAPGGYVVVWHWNPDTYMYDYWNNAGQIYSSGEVLTTIYSDTEYPYDIALANDCTLILDC